MDDTTYGISYQLRPEHQGGGTSDDGAMMDFDSAADATKYGADLAMTGRYVRLSVYHWNTGTVAFELERF